MSEVKNNSDDVAKASRKINGWKFMVLLTMTANVALSFKIFYMTSGQTRSYSYLQRVFIGQQGWRQRLL